MNDSFVVGLVSVAVLGGAAQWLGAVQERFAAGARFKSTPLTEKFGMDEWRARYGETAVPLLTVSEGGVVTVATADHALSPTAGDLLMGLSG